MAQYKICPNCGANLDPDEICECTKDRDSLQKRANINKTIPNQAYSVTKSRSRMKSR